MQPNHEQSQENKQTPMKPHSRQLQVSRCKGTKKVKTETILAWGIGCFCFGFGINVPGSSTWSMSRVRRARISISTVEGYLFRTIASKFRLQQLFTVFGAYGLLESVSVEYSGPRISGPVKRALE